MTVLRRIARPLLAAVFIVDGIDAVLHTDAHLREVERFRPQITRVSEALGVPDDPSLLIRASGVLTIGAAFMLATGRAPRLAALTLAAATVPLTIAKYPVLAAKSKAERREYLEGTIRSASLLGGLLIAGADTAGKPSLGWRVNRVRATKGADLKAQAGLA